MRGVSERTPASPAAPGPRARAHTGPGSGRQGALPEWWPLAALMVLAAALRFSTLDLQSFWYDEAFTPVHVLRASLFTTLRGVVHTENTPPLWYVLEWGISRVLGTGEVALRLLSAFAGLATVPVAWAIGAEIEGPPTTPTRRRATAIAAAALVAVNPLFVWYSQEARAYGLFVLMAALAMLCFLRAEHDPTPRRMAAFALTGALALLTHYFAVFLLIPMVLALLWDRASRRLALPAAGAIGLVGLALLPLISAQGGHGTQWIGEWPLSERLEAIPQYYLTGYSGEPLGHGIELLVALPIIAGLGLWLWRVLEQPAAARERARASDPTAAAERDREQRGALIVLFLAACGVLLPIVLVAFGADYLAPRNLVAAMIPLTALIAVVVVSQRTGRAGIALAVLIAVAFLAVSVDVDLSPRLQRGNWRGVAKALRVAPRERVITTVELGSTPLEYYLPELHGLREGSTVRVREIDETGYAPLVPGAAEPPAPGFHLAGRLDVNGLIVYRFVSPIPRTVSEATLRRHVITLATPSVLVPRGLQVSS